MNRVNTSGRLTKDPELKYTESNMAICRFTIASQRNYKNAMGEYDSDFIRCIAFNKSAEALNQHCKKGDLIGVDGRIQTGSYDDKDGNKIYTTDVVADRIDFFNLKRSENKSNQHEETPYDYEEPAEEKSEDPFADFGENIKIDDNFLE